MEKTLVAWQNTSRKPSLIVDFPISLRWTLLVIFFNSFEMIESLHSTPIWPTGKPNQIINIGILIYNLLKCKTDPHGLKPFKALKDRNMRESNTQKKPKMHAKTTMKGLMQLGHLNVSKL